MIPSAKDLTSDIKIKKQPSNTYKLHFYDDDSVIGFTDGLDAIKQAVYKILQTERYQYLIYSWRYGIELDDLIGKPIPFVYAELERRVTDALIQDDRIEGVEDFTFSAKDESVLMQFTVITKEGSFKEEVTAHV